MPCVKGGTHPKNCQLLMEKVFPRQATVVSAAELVAALAQVEGR
jgi:hypothetical protein